MKKIKTNSKSRRFALIFLIALFNSIVINAQNISKKFSFDLTLLGSSNIHDWKMKATGNNLDASFTFNTGTKQLEGIQPLILNMPVKGLKSNEDLLNSRAYDALRADKYPNFVFKITSTKVNGNQIDIMGLLSVSGQTREITLPATIRKNADGSIVLSGSKKIKMTEFGVTPPKYMLGMMRVYDDLTLNYSVRF